MPLNQKGGLRWHLEIQCAPEVRFVEFMSVGEKNVMAAMRDLEGRMKGLGKRALLVGAALAGLGAAVTAPYLAGLAVASEWSSGIISANRRTGISFQDLQTLSFALNLDLDELATSARKMNSFLDEAMHDPGSAAARRLEELSAAAGDASLNVQSLMRLSEADRYRQLAGALASVPDPSQRGATATQIFGRNAMSANVSGGSGRPGPDAELQISPARMGTATKSMNEFLAAAAGGSENARQQLRELNLTVEDLMRLSDADRVSRLSDAIRTIRNPTQSANANKEIFGATNVAPKAAGGIAEREERAKRFSMSDSDIALMREYNAAQRELGLATRAIWASLGAAAAGPMTNFFKTITNLILTVKDWTQTNRPLLTTIFQVADAVVLVGTVIGFIGTGIIGVGYAIRYMSFAFSTGMSLLKLATTILTGGIGLLTTVTFIYKLVALGAALATKVLAASFALASAAAASLWSIGLLPLVVGIGVVALAVGALIIFLPGLWNTWLSGMQIILGSMAGVTSAVSTLFSNLGSNLATMFVNLGSTFKQTFGALMDVLPSGDIGAAWAIIVAGLTKAWLGFVLDLRITWFDLVEDFKGVWNDGKIWFLQSFVSIGSGISIMMTAAFMGIRSAWSSMVEWMAVLLSKSLTKIEEMWIRARESLNPFGSEERTERLVEESRQSGVEREKQIARDGVTDRERIEDAGAASIVEIARREAAARARIAAENVFERGNADEDPGVQAAREELNLATLELNRLTEAAAKIARHRDKQNYKVMDEAREGTEQIVTQSHNQGTFSASAASGFSGAGPIDGLKRVAERQLEKLDKIIEVLEKPGARPQMG